MSGCFHSCTQDLSDFFGLLIIEDQQLLKHLMDEKQQQIFTNHDQCISNCISHVIPEHDVCRAATPCVCLLSLHTMVHINVSLLLPLNSYKRGGSVLMLLHENGICSYHSGHLFEREDPQTGRGKKLPGFYNFRKFWNVAIEIKVFCLALKV